MFKYRGDFYSRSLISRFFHNRENGEISTNKVYTRDVIPLMLVIDLIVGAGVAKTAKRSRSSRKGKRPLSSSAVPAPKQPKLLNEEGKVRFCVI